MGSALVGFGKAVPALVVANETLETLVDTSDEWIVTRTGIQSRHVAIEETNADLAEAAARDALGWTNGGFSERRFDASEIDLVVFATITPDTVCPSMAGLLRRRL
ncbi:MAG: ketoacyl-ACP synthase III, partial [Gordonibacter sp.]